MTKEQLSRCKPCPECGSKDLVSCMGLVEVCICCRVCGQMGEDADTVDGAVDKWNQGESK